MATITEQTIRQRSNSGGFERGKRYYKQGAISDTAKRSNTLEARCQGSQYKPYQVKVTLDKNDAIKETFCNAETAQKLELVLELRLLDFYNPPHYIAKYEALKQAAQLLNRWDTIYQEIITYLQKNTLYALLTQVYLHEKNAEEAWKALALHQNLSAKDRNT